MSALSKISAEKDVVEEQADAGKRGTLLIEGSCKPPSLEAIVDLTNTVDTTSHTKQLAATTHEHVKVNVHQIIEERITREIHYHDTFHRIQPVIDVEILPTKHFIPAADGILREIPASAIPGRQNNWHIVVGPATLSSHPYSSSDLKNASLTGVEAQSPLKSVELKPVQTSHRVVPSSDGVERTETTWRHPSVVMPTSYNDDDNSIRSGKEINTHGRQEPEEDLQSRGTGYGYCENLPNLKEQTPMALPTLRSITTADRMRAVMGKGENTLRRMKTKLTHISSDDGSGEVEKPMGDLSLRD